MKPQPLTLRERLIVLVRVYRSEDAPNTHPTKYGRIESSIWNTRTTGDMVEDIMETVGGLEEGVLLCDNCLGADDE